MKIGDYVIVRSEAAGVFAGTLAKHEKREVTLIAARRIWYWAGAASLSELAQRGTSKPNDCKFPVAVDEVVILGAIELLAVTPEARASIEAVPIWTR